MSLYEDEELGAAPTDVAVGWSRGVQLMQSQMQLKKAAAKTTPTLVPGNFSGPANAAVGSSAKQRASLPVLAPVIDFKSKAKSEDSVAPPSSGKKSSRKPFSGKKSLATNDRTNLLPLGDPSWTPVNEYDPRWPNDYSKVSAEMRESKRSTDDEDAPRKRRYTEGGREKARERFDRDGKNSSSASGGQVSGFGRRPRCDDYSDEEDDRRGSRRGSSASARRSAGSSGGAAIAPPPSLTEPSIPTQPNSQGDEAGDGVAANKGGLGIAAKIMAKYGYRQGQGLGRAQQGMSQALSVEKTSKRGGRILHEKDLMPPPMFGESLKSTQLSATPPSLSQIEDEYGDPSSAEDALAKPSITDLMKAPSKVVLCKNMVGPGEVDAELEPEVKEECNGKYGDVVRVMIYELQNVTPEEAVRIFIEFKRVESAIKAVVDLNGRFFGGREVQAQFYDHDKFSTFNLGE